MTDIESVVSTMAGLDPSRPDSLTDSGSIRDGAQITEKTEQVTVSSEIINTKGRLKTEQTDTNKGGFAAGPGREYASLLGLNLAALLMALDGTIIVAAIPQITGQFDSIRDIGWYGSVYYLTLVLAQPIFGKLFFQLRIQYVFLSALLIFEIGSVISATAKGSSVLIVGRAIAGFGGGGLFSGSLIMANLLASPTRKPIYIGLIGSVYGVGTAVGPLLGGVFTDSSVTWRFCFWLNLPVGALCALGVSLYPTAARCLNAPKFCLRTTLLRLDLVGTVLLTGSLVCLLLALQWGGSSYPWDNRRVIGLLVGFAAILLVFAIKERFFSPMGQTMLNFRLLSNRTVALACVTELFFTMAIRAQYYYLPIFFQVVRHLSPTLSGVYLTPYLGGVAIAPLLTGIAVSRTRLWQPFLWSGLALLLIGSGLIYTFDQSTSIGLVLGSQLLAGFGSGIITQTLITAVQSAASTPQDIPFATSLLTFCVCLGPTISISAAQNIFIDGLRTGLGPPGSKVIASGGGSVMAGTGSAAQELGSTSTSATDEEMIDAYNTALTRVFLYSLVLAGAAFLAALGVKLKRMPKKG